MTKEIQVEKRPTTTQPTEQQQQQQQQRLRHRSSSSVQMILNHVTHPPSDHPLSTETFQKSPKINNSNNSKPSGSSSSTKPSDQNSSGSRKAQKNDSSSNNNNIKDEKSTPSDWNEKKKKKKREKKLEYWEESSKGFWNDLKTMRWMRHPGTSFKMILIFLVSWTIFESMRSFPIINSNPISPFVKISYELEPTEEEILREDGKRYGKGLKDLLFLSFYVIVFSFLRQAVIEYVVRPYAKWLGLKGIKLQRFIDQGYAVFYWGSSTIIGLIVMSEQPTWWYKTSEFWRGYPHDRMRASLKSYYLLQLSYWLQQMLVLSLRLEKPRSDFMELVIHHFVTLWLVGWSYITNLTMIGTSVFVSMDISDVFLGVSKCINYTKYQRTSEVSFAIFLCVWTYFRHWQNLRILYSVWFEYDEYVPKFARRWSVKDGVFLTGWMKWQIFSPILLLQFLNLFWYFLIWRIVFRMITVGNIADVREEGETTDDEEEEEEEKEKTKSKTKNNNKKSDDDDDDDDDGKKKKVKTRVDGSESKVDKLKEQKDFKRVEKEKNS